MLVHSNNETGQAGSALLVSPIQGHRAADTGRFAYVPYPRASKFLQLLAPKSHLNIDNNSLKFYSHCVVRLEFDVKAYYYQ